MGAFYLFNPLISFFLKADLFLKLIGIKPRRYLNLRYEYWHAYTDTTPPWLPLAETEETALKGPQRSVWEIEQSGSIRVRPPRSTPTRSMVLCQPLSGPSQ